MHYVSLFPSISIVASALATATAMAMVLCLPTTAIAQTQAAAPLASLRVQPPQSAHWISADAVVEAVRDTTVSSQVPGAITALLVQVGDRVQAGQPLLRLEAQAAQQNAQASIAQVQAARTQAELAEKELQRQQHLFAKQYISQAGLDKAQTQKDAAQAQVRALQAQASAATAQTNFYVVHAPYAGIVSEVPVALGDMATPGRPLVRLYDPRALRITATVAQSLLQTSQASAIAAIELPHTAHARIPVKPQEIQPLPTVDAHTHTVQLRVKLPAELSNDLVIAPGTFARLWLATDTASHTLTPALVRIPSSAVVRRAEMTGVYVLDDHNRPRLRQVRLGRTLTATENNGTGGTGGIAPVEIEVLSGLRHNERVALDPQAAAHQTMAQGPRQ